MSKFAEKAQTFSGVITDIDGKKIVVQVGGEPLTFTVEGAVAEELKPGHEVTVVTWGSSSAVRVVDHATNTLYRPYYNDAPEEVNLAEANRSQADASEAKMGLTSLLPAVFLATVFQSIPLYGWYVTYKMAANADNSIPGTAPQYAKSAKGYYLVFIALAFVFSWSVFSTSGDLLKAGLAYMTLVYAGTFMLMRIIFRGIQEIDDFARQQIARRTST